MLDDSLRLSRADEWLKLREARERDSLEASEVAKQSRFQFLAHARYRSKLASEIAHRSPLSVISHGEAVSLVADHLNQMKYRRVMIYSDRLVAPFDEQQLFALGYRSRRQGFKSQLVQRTRRRAKLP